MLKTSGEAVNIAPMPAAQATATQADAKDITQRSLPCILKAASKRTRHGEEHTSARRENREEGKREVERQVVHEKANGTVGVT